MDERLCFPWYGEIAGPDRRLELKVFQQDLGPTEPLSVTHDQIEDMTMAAAHRFGAGELVQIGSRVKSTTEPADLHAPSRLEGARHQILPTRTACPTPGPTAGRRAPSAPAPNICGSKRPSTATLGLANGSASGRPGISSCQSGRIGKLITLSPLIPRPRGGTPGRACAHSRPHAPARCAAGDRSEGARHGPARAAIRGCSRRHLGAIRRTRWPGQTDRCVRERLHARRPGSRLPT